MTDPWQERLDTSGRKAVGGAGMDECGIHIVRRIRDSTKDEQDYERSMEGTRQDQMPGKEDQQRQTPTARYVANRIATSGVRTENQGESMTGALCLGRD